MSKTTILRTALAFALAALIAGPTLAQNPPKETSGGESVEARPTRANLRAVTRELAEEGEEGLEDQKRWPREEPDYAQEKNLEMRDRELVMALGRQLDRTPAIDGYVKWQLLSFEPDFAEVGQKGYAAMAKGLPRITPRPELPRAHQRALAAAQKQAREEVKPQLRKVIEQFRQSVEEVEMLNGPTIAYREAAVAAMPEENGIRMMIRMRDIEDRFEAGDLTYRDAVGALLARARDRKDDEELSPAARRRLIAEAERLNTLRSTMIEDAHLLASGKVELATLGRVYRHRQFEQITAYFKGEEPDS